MGEDQSGSKLKRDMGVIGILFAAVGSIVGSGWLFGALYAAEAAGPASTISWFLGAILMMFIALVYAELGTMFPVSGGVVRYPHFAFGSFASYSIGWITWFAAAATTSIEVLAAMQYATNYIPWMQEISADGSAVLTTAGYFVAIGMLALFSVVNFIGIKWFEKLNNALVWWKIAIVVVVIIAFMYMSFHGSHFTNEAAGGFFPFGWEGVFTAISTAGVCFSFLGFRQGVELAGETKNPARNVPIAVIGSILITMVLYVLLQVAFIGALPMDSLIEGWANIGANFAGNLSEVAATFGPLAAIAGIMGLSWVVYLLYIDAFISPADTGLIYTTVTSRLSYAMGLNGNFPRSLAKVNKKGVPWVSVILTFVAGTVFFFIFPGWEKIVGFVTAGTVLSFGSGPVSLIAMRKQLPKKNRPFKLPLFNAICFLAFLAANLIVYWSGWADVWKLMVAIFVGYIILIINEIANHKRTPALEIKSGLWIFVWLAGLCLISYLGPYPSIHPSGKTKISGGLTAATSLNTNSSKNEHKLKGVLMIYTPKGDSVGHALKTRDINFIVHHEAGATPHLSGNLILLDTAKGAKRVRLTGKINVYVGNNFSDTIPIAGNMNVTYLGKKTIQFTAKGDFKVGFGKDASITPLLVGQIHDVEGSSPQVSNLAVNIDNTKKIAGNRALIGIGWDVLIFALFTLFIIWLATKSRLPDDKVKKHLEGLNFEEEG